MSLIGHAAATCLQLMEERRSIEAGYFDQAHLTRSLKHLIGQTPVEIGRRTKQLSYYTAPLP